MREDFMRKKNIMYTFKITIAITLAFLLTGCSKVSQARQPVKGETFVLVHGAWGGGWAFREVDDIMTAAGDKVYRPTLTGQGEKVHLASLDIGLDTHINDVVNTLLYEDINDVVLVGHSYGGMVVTGVADRIPERISRLIYLDALVPEDGESARTINNRKDAGWTSKPIKDGFLIPSWVSADQAPPKDVPHPLKTLTDPIVLKNPARLQIPTDYILTVDPGKEPQEDGFYPYSQRAKAKGWPVYILDADHNAQWSNPKGLSALLKKVAEK
jgi:pimeloyl-ACP methyl ester carboxylesterase